jgi:hypothetical protein
MPEVLAIDVASNYQSQAHFWVFANRTKVCHDPGERRAAALRSPSRIVDGGRTIQRNFSLFDAVVFVQLECHC